MSVIINRTLDSSTLELQFVFSASIEVFGAADPVASFGLPNKKQSHAEHN